MNKGMRKRSFLLLVGFIFAIFLLNYISAVLTVNVPLQSKWVLKGSNIEFNIKLTGEAGMDILFEYLIIDENNKLISQQKETKTIEEREEFKINFNLPEDLDFGIYRIFVQITYNPDKIISAKDSFEVVKDDSVIMSRKIIYFLPALSIAIILFLVLLRLLMRKRRYKPERKKRVREIRIVKLKRPKLVKYREKKKIRKLVVKEKVEIINSISAKQRARKGEIERRQAKRMIEQVRNYK